MEQLYTPQEVADQLRIKKTTVYELIKRGELESSKIGKQIRISRQQVEEYLHGQLPQPVTGDLAGGNLQREYLEEGKGLVISGQDSILDHLALQLPELPLLRTYMNDYNSLTALYFGKIHIACVALPALESGLPDFRQVSALLPGMSLGALHLYTCESGLYLTPSAAKQVRGVEDLAKKKIPFLNREKGNSQRMLLDKELRRRNLSGASIPGYSREVLSDLAAASSLLAKEADAALGTRLLLSRFPRLSFLPLWNTSVDLIFHGDLLGTSLLDTLNQAVLSPDFRRAVAELPGYHAQRLGQLTTL